MQLFDVADRLQLDLPDAGRVDVDDAVAVMFGGLLHGPGDFGHERVADIGHGKRNLIGAAHLQALRRNARDETKFFDRLKHLRFRFFADAPGIVDGPGYRRDPDAGFFGDVFDGDFRVF